MSNSPVMYDETLSDVLQRARQDADRRVALAEQRATRAERELAERQALIADEEPFEREAPPVPSMAELLRPTPGVTRFLDSLYGAPDR